MKILCKKCVLDTALGQENLWSVLYGKVSERAEFMVNVSRAYEASHVMYLTSDFKVR
jgi:hypothetical protein